MKPITSLFDLFTKAQTDKRYRLLVAFAYKDYTGADCDQAYGLGKVWLNAWAKRNVGETKRMQNCSKMVEYINDLIPRFEQML